MTIFWEKGGIVFKGGHYIREDLIQGNTVIFEMEECEGNKTG